MLRYHEGQIALQDEANTRDVADMLADWSGPVTEFCRTADLIILATRNRQERLAFTAFSGIAPLAESPGVSQILLRSSDLTATNELSSEVVFGGIAINLGAARRARINGVMRQVSEGLLLTAREAFTNCRKYIAPSEPLDSTRHFGPTSREAIDLNSADLADVVAKAETSFLATTAPDGSIDVSHRGGPPGFLDLDSAARQLRWDEYVGDGMFKSAGNIRATGDVSLLVHDLLSGTGYELIGRADVTIRRRDKTPRMDALMQGPERYPVQGSVTCEVDAVNRLESITHPRRRLEKWQKVTSVSDLEQQYPH